MTALLISRMIGMLIFGIIGFRVNEAFNEAFAESINVTRQEAALLFLALGALTGLLGAPWLSVYPWRRLRHTIASSSLAKLVLALAGALTGLLLALLLAFPLSLLGDPLGKALPALVSIVFGWLGLAAFSLRSDDLLEFVGARYPSRQRRSPSVSASARQLLLDTSVLIDGRIVEIAETGFIGGSLLIPRFVLSELHRVADSADSLRRNRGRRGLAKLKELQRSHNLPVKIVDDDPEELEEVDAKLVALCMQLKASLMTNDFNLNQVADAQGVDVLNINALANAVRSVYIPGETFDIRIMQAGRDPNQGIGYLDDGTMVVVESGQKYMDRNIGVEVTKLINRPTGRMIFAVPARSVPR